MAPGPSRTALLLLADGRLPTGGHAHSGGLEAAVASGRVRGADELDAWLRGRLATVGRVDAAVAVAAHDLANGAAPQRWEQLAGEWAARTPAPAQRAASCAQGRGLRRAGRRAWGGDLLDDLPPGPAGVPWPIALGAVGWVAGVDRDGVALVAVSGAVGGPAWAATRLLSLDPFAVAKILADLGPVLDEEAARACRCVELPSPSAPLLDLDAERHARWEVRLFAS